MPDPAPRRILIVDDERDLALPLARRLAALGRFEVAVAFDGRDGARRAFEFRPETVLVDLAMPEIDGWELCRILRADPRTREARLVVMTAWVSSDLGRRAAAAGAARLLLKPFQEAELMEALDASIC
jgi:CheY-like chemotaxis protein